MIAPALASSQQLIANSYRVTARDGCDDLVLLGIRIEGCVVEHMLRPDSPGHRATFVARLAQNAFGFDDAFARLLSLCIGVPFHQLMSASIGDDDAAHAR